MFCPLTCSHRRFYVDDELILTVDPAAEGHTNFWEYGNFASDAPGIDNPWAYTTNKLAPFDQEVLVFDIWFMKLSVADPAGAPPKIGSTIVFIRMLKK